MKKKSLVKILAMSIVVLFNVVNTQPVFAKDTILSEKKSDIKQLLFETISDIANNKEIQDIIQKYECKKSLLGFQHLQVNLQKEINDVIENNDAINKKLEQLSDLYCDCETGKAAIWKFPILCTLLLPLWWLFVYLAEVGGNIIYLITIPIFQVLNFLAYKFECYWLNAL